MKRYHLKQVSYPGADEIKKARWKVDELFKRLNSFYGAQELVLKASKLDALELMNSNNQENRILALRRILFEDPTINILPRKKRLLQEIALLEEAFAEIQARRQIEEELQNSIQQKMNEKHNEYLRDIKMQLLKEQSNSPENARTLKNLGKLEKMESIQLSKSVLELLRPASFKEMIGQEKAINSLVPKLNTPYPQHILLYGPPGVGKTSCARLALEAVKESGTSSFGKEAPFIEVDGTTLRWDPREATNPLIGSVHDPIYQGASKYLAEDGIPEPKPGLVCDAHGGILFIDEIGEMDPNLQNKLLKVLEDKRVYFESAYYDPQNDRIPQYIKQIFEQGIPADFVLIGATTRSPESISPALRSRCMEIFFEPLSPEDIAKIVEISAKKLKIDIEEGLPNLISCYADDGRSANKLLVDAYSIAINKPEQTDTVLVTKEQVYEAIRNSRIIPYRETEVADKTEVGKIFGVGAWEFRGKLLEIEAIAFTAEHNGEGKVRFNDTAGTMARDSVFNAVSLMRMEIGNIIYNYDLHINFVGGGKVDGPSAGLAIYLVMLSAVQNRPIRQDIAVTGEISLQGRVKPVGGLHEKLNAARQAGIKKLLIPYANKDDISKTMQTGLEIVPIKAAQEAYIHVFA